jgi:hypothetical protein
MGETTYLFEPELPVFVYGFVLFGVEQLGFSGFPS